MVANPGGGDKPLCRQARQALDWATAEAVFNSALATDEIVQIERYLHAVRICISAPAGVP
jgi:hypothetical protein